MERSLCLLAIICMFVCIGEAQFGPNWPWPQPGLPSSITEICGPSTSQDLANEVFEAFTKAINYGLDKRNDAWGWTPEPFTSTARAIMNLQLSTDATWYHGYGQQFMDQQSTDDRKTARRDPTTRLSVRQLEFEVLTFLTRYLNGEDSLELMGDTEFASNLVALSLTCHNIFDFFGQDLYDIMNDRQRRFGDGVTIGASVSGPATFASCDSIIPGGSANIAFFYGFGLLVACQNVEEINPDFFRCTIEAQNNGLYAEPLVIPGLGPYPLGYGDLQLLGMSCVRDRVPDQYKNQWSAIMTRISNWMINMQGADGSFGGNPIATTLAIQSLKSAEASFDTWDCEDAVRNLLTLQDDEGVIADSLGITLLALPTLSGQSMAYVNEIEPECFKWPYFWKYIVNNDN